jgi:hypothetical protein
MDSPRPEWVIAIERGHLETLRECKGLERAVWSPKVTSLFDWGESWTPLGWAIYKDAPMEFMQELVWEKNCCVDLTFKEERLDGDVTEEWRWSPLGLAIDRGRPDVVLFLLQEDADPEQIFKMAEDRMDDRWIRWYPLEYAARIKGCRSCVLHLLDHRASLRGDVPQWAKRLKVGLMRTRLAQRSLERIFLVHRVYGRVMVAPLVKIVLDKLWATRQHQLWQE